MAIKRAKVLDDNTLAGLLTYIRRTSVLPERDKVIFLLNYKAGLRAQEIAGLEWKDVTDPLGTIGERGDEGVLKMTIPSNIAKKGHERDIPMHSEIQSSLSQLRQTMPEWTPASKIICGAPNTKLKTPKEQMSPNAVAQMMRRLYYKAGMMGCSSHSGRRTFITKLSRNHNKHNCSIKDVQVLAGHKDIRTTEKYIEPSVNAHRLIEAI